MNNLTENSTILHKTFQVNSYQIHYYVSGPDNNEPLVFLHPAFGDHRCFNSQIEYFSKDYKVITIDMIGHGRSQPLGSRDRIDCTPGHIHGILEIEGLQSAHFVGVSMGSLMVQYMALLHPDMVRSMTIVGGYNIHFENKEIMKAQRNEIFRWLVFALRPIKHMKRYIARSVSYKKENQDKFLDYQEGYDRNIFSVMRGLGDIVQQRDGFLNTCPTLLVVGEEDKEIAKNAAHEWHQLDPSTHLLIIPEAGHCANMDQPVPFNKYLARFLSEINR